MIYENFLSQFTDWRPTQLYWQRFSIADSYGKNEIQKVYSEIFKEAKTDYKFLTELVMVLNHKSWEHSQYQGNSSISKLYSDLFYETKEYAEDVLSGIELSYFLDTID